MFSKYLAEVSDQKFLVQVFAPGEIVPAFQVFDAVSAGTLEMGNTASCDYIGKDLAFAFGIAVPFGFNTRQMNAWLSYGGGLELLNDLYKGHNVWGVPFGIRPPRWAAGSAKRSKPSMTSRVSNFGSVASLARCSRG